MKNLLQHLAAIKDKGYQQAFALPGDFYTDPQWTEVERKQLFHGKWVCVGRIEEVQNKGDYMAVDLAGEPVVVVHGLDGSIRALSNVCRHRGTVIATGKGNAKSLLCPYHHWAYDTEGKLVNAPMINADRPADLSGCRLPGLGCMLWQGFVFVNIDATARDLITELEPLQQIIGHYHLEQMHLHYLEEVTWHVNWKSLVENFMEGYHLSPLHRSTLHKVNPTSLCQHIEPGKNYFGYKVGFTSRLPEERIGHADLTDQEMDTCVMFAVPPGLTVGIGSDYSSFLCIQPRGPHQVRVKMGLIFHGEHWSDKQVDAAVKLFKDTMDEDKAVLLQVQQGMHSGLYQPGPLAPKDLEGTIWDFHQYLSRTIKA